MRPVEDIFAREDEEDIYYDNEALDDAVEYYTKVAEEDSPMKNHYRQLGDWLSELIRQREEEEERYQDWLDEREREEMEDCW